MKEVAVHLVVACFEGAMTAVEAMIALKSARNERLLDYKGAAVIWRDVKDKIHIEEAADPGGGHGAAAGGVIGAVIGMLAGPAGVIIGGAAGALVGSLAAGSIDTGISNKRMRKIGKKLKPGGSAVVVISEEGWTEEVTLFFKTIGALVTVETLSGDVAGQLVGDEE